MGLIPPHRLCLYVLHLYGEWREREREREREGERERLYELILLY